MKERAKYEKPEEKQSSISTENRIGVAISGPCDGIGLVLPVFIIHFITERLAIPIMQASLVIWDAITDLILPIDLRGG